MTKQIEISIDVFAAIWAARKDGEDTENDILARLFNIKSDNSVQLLNFTSDQVTLDGYLDNRNDVHFSEGFNVFRNYKGKIYFARATNGQWLRVDTNHYFPSLNKLNESIVAGNENIWNGNWQYVDENSTICSIENLRKK